MISQSFENKNDTDFADKQYDDAELRKSLSTKENTVYGSPPYMPILIENIPNYVQLKDFEFDRIKEIQTVGIVFGKDLQTTFIYNCDKQNLISVQLSFECLTKKSLTKIGYKLGSKFPCKLFGRLINYKGKPLLEAHHLLKTDDLQGCLKTTTMLSQIVRQKYHYFQCKPNP